MGPVVTASVVTRSSGLRWNARAVSAPMTGTAIAEHIQRSLRSRFIKTTPLLQVVTSIPGAAFRLFGKLCGEPLELLEPLEDLKTKHLNEASMSHVGVLAALILAAAQAVEPLYFVHRISIAGNIVTHDEVIRRELGLVEGGVFDLQAL